MAVGIVLAQVSAQMDPSLLKGWRVLKEKRGVAWKSRGVNEFEREEKTTGCQAASLKEKNSLHPRAGGNPLLNVARRNKDTEREGGKVVGGARDERINYAYEPLRVSLRRHFKIILLNVDRHRCWRRLQPFHPPRDGSPCAIPRARGGGHPRKFVASLRALFC